MKQSVKHPYTPPQSHSVKVTSFSKITKADKLLLQQAVRKFRPDSIFYEDSWGYIIQATRYNGFKWYDPNTESLIFFCRKSPTDSTLIVPNFFCTTEYLIKVLNQIKIIEKPQKVILKNINPGEIKDYANFNFGTYEENEEWCEEARYDDQTYPQLIVDLNLIKTIRGKKFTKIRRVLNKRLPFSVRPYKDSDKNAILNILTLKDALTKDPSERMYYISHKMYPTADLGKLVITDERTEEIIGFTCTSNITDTTTTLVAAIFKPGLQHVSTWGIYYTLLAKANEGFTKANLGGNESSGSFNFMREKFRPTLQIPKTHLVYKPQKSNE